MTIAACISRLSLANFRSYPSAGLTVQNGSVVLIGANGAGKTNLLEAISFLAPGRGLRPARAQPLCRASTSLITTDVDGRAGTLTQPA